MSSFLGWFSARKKREFGLVSLIKIVVEVLNLRLGF